MSKRSLIFLTALTILLAALPYVYAAQQGGGDLVFNGFLLNPLDGNSYLAKMREGWLGSWQFSMLYSSQVPHGSYLFLFYFALGHLARWLGLPLLLVFHIARIAGAIVLCSVLYRFIESYLADHTPRARIIAFTLLCLGSGFGWLAAFLGGFTADFWVAEAYPFLSMYANPHFPLGLALLLDFFILLRQPHSRKIDLWLAVKGLLLATIMPFGVVVAAVVAGGVQLWDLIKREFRIRWWMLYFFVPGGLTLLYQFSIIRSDPVLAAWNAQNLTVTPPIWDFVISFSPALLLAAVTIALLIRKKTLNLYKLLAVWLIGGLVLAYVPFQLQRRFLFGYFIPVASLAAIAIDWALANAKRSVRIGAGVLVGLSFLTNLMVISGGVLAAAQRSPDLYYSQNLQQVFDWMLVNHKSCDVVLATPKIGAIIPGATGWRVVYGHPYETPNAAEMKAQVERIFSGMMSQPEILVNIQSLGVDFILVGPADESVGVDMGWVHKFPKIYAIDDVSLFQVRDCP